MLGLHHSPTASHHLHYEKMGGAKCYNNYALNVSYEFLSFSERENANVHCIPLFKRNPPE